jgi:hypothetical protein
MPITVDEILELEERLRLEIAEKQCLLDAYRTLRAHVTQAREAATAPAPTGHSSLAAAALVAPAANASLVSSPSVAAAAPESTPAPVPQPRPYINKELEKVRRLGGGTTGVVKWAIARMTNDYSVGDIVALLDGEDYRISSSEVSVVLTRLKQRREIEQIHKGRGRNGTIFRKPENPVPFQPRTSGQNQEDGVAKVMPLQAVPNIPPTVATIRSEQNSQVSSVTGLSRLARLLEL